MPASASQGTTQSLSTHPARGSVAKSFGWLLGDQIVKALGGGIVGVMIARHFGPADFGRWSVAISVTTFGVNFVSLGLNRLVQSELSSRQSRAGAIVSTHLVLGLIAAAIIIGLTAGFTYRIDDEQTRRLTLILVWLSLPSAFGAADIWFQSQGSLRTITIYKNVVWLLFLILRVGLVVFNATLTVFAVAVLAERVLIFLVAWLLFARQAPAFRRMRFSPSLARKWARYGWPAAVLLMVTVATDSIMQFLVQDLVGTAAAGHFGAGFRLAEFWWAVAPMAAVAILPRLTRKHAETSINYQKDFNLYLDLSSAVTIGVALLGTFICPWLISLIFGERYAASSPILVLLLWTAPPIFSAFARTQHLTVKRTLLIELPNSLTVAVLSISLCLILAPHYGAMGAATAIVVSWWIGVFVTPWFIPSARPLARLQWASLTSLFRLPALWKEISHLLPQSFRSSTS